MKTLYTAHATATGGREGKIETDDKRISTKLSRPGDVNGGGTNPEQLFACGYAACFGGAVQHLAKQQGLDIGEVTVHADVTLNQDDANAFFIGATLRVSLPTLDKATAEKLIHDTHQFCPYSKATRCNIEVTLIVNDQTLSKAA